MAVDVQSAEGPNEMLVDDVPKQSDTAGPSAQASTTQFALAKKKKRAGKKQQPSDESAAPLPPTAAPQTRRREICEWIVPVKGHSFHGDTDGGRRANSCRETAGKENAPFGTKVEVCSRDGSKSRCGKTTPNEVAELDG